MRLSAVFNGVVDADGLAALLDLLVAAEARGPQMEGRILANQIVSVEPELFSPAACHRLGVDVCLSEYSLTGTIARRTLHLRGMAPVRFLSTAGKPASAAPGDFDPAARGPAADGEVRAWLAHLAWSAFSLRRAQSAHEIIRLRRAISRVVPAPSPFAIGPLEVAAARRIPYHARTTAADIDDARRLMAIHADPAAFAPGWRMTETVAVQ